MFLSKRLDYQQCFQTEALLLTQLRIKRAMREMHIPMRCLLIRMATWAKRTTGTKRSLTSCQTTGKPKVAISSELIRLTTPCTAAY
jgi:hypothetical protein